jgi:hypothetical protein
MDNGYPDTPEKRKAGMAAFRAKMLKTHESLLAGDDANTKRKDATGDAARAFHGDMIDTIKSAQKKFGEV